MTTDQPRPSSPPAVSLALACEGDEAGAYKGRVLEGDTLRAHAADIARLHGAPKLLLRTGPLPGLFAQTRATIETAYSILGAEAGTGVDSISAEEWLLDNRYVIEEQIREIEDDLPRGYLRKLPRVTHGAHARYPRVYAACLDYLLHTDARLDPDSLALYIDGYQTVSPLTIGELWAIPIMLRLGLLVVLGEAARAVTSNTGRARANALTSDLVDHPHRADEILDRLERANVDAPLLVHLWRLLREHESSSHTIQWIRDRAMELGASPEELGHRLHLRQAADQLAVANAIASMRAITTYEWSQFFERASVVEKILSRDGTGTYSRTDPACRDKYRHAVERVALRAGLDEPAVATRALDLARRHEKGARSCVGYYLENDGVYELERACGARLTARERVARAITTHPRAFYFTLVPAVTAMTWAAVVRSLRGGGAATGEIVVLSALLLFAASEIALPAIGALVVALLPPRLLSRLSLEHGITPENRTLVVVPVLFDSVETVDHLVDALEVRALANPDPDLHFALASDFTDAPHEREAGDDELVEHAIARIRVLNQRYPLSSGLPKYALFHRRRVRNDSQGCFMGWERKRGKLEELNRLILGQRKTTFSEVTAPRALLSSIRYVITLDADTDMPRSAATNLVGTLAHPLNRPVLSADGTRVVEGYAVIQPRVGTVPSSARRSRFARVSAGSSALDPYTTAVSDVYQDLFGEGSYVGKAIYDVRAFAAVHDGRTPENRLLSHDLFEGVLARTALASNVELLDEQPSSYGVVARRAHRWMRGDWQLISLLGLAVETPAGRRPRGLGLVGMWKVVDNLRRSLLAPTSVLAFVLSCILWPRATPRVALVLGVMLAAPVVLRLLSDVLRRGRSRAAYDGLWRDVRTTLTNATLSAVLLFDQAVIALDAIARTLYRLAVSKRHLLEWQPTGLDRASANTPLRMWLEVPVLALIASAALIRTSNWLCVPVVACWMLAPALVEWLARPLPIEDRASRLTEAERRTLREIARRTWLFFETFVTEEDHFLPPDNFQEEPRGVVAHRTSPTNIGLYLMATLTARDMGYAGSRELVRRLAATFDTIDRLEKHQGHVLNWYDTKTLQPLEPRYVSTVDSGNLAGYLWAVRRGCEEWAERPIVGPEVAAAVADASRLAGAGSVEGPTPSELGEIVAWLERAADGQGGGDWGARAKAASVAWLDEVEQLLPHFAWMRSAPATLADVPAFVTLRDVLRHALSPAAVAEAAHHVAIARDALAKTALSDDARSWLHELFARVERAASTCARLVDDLRRTGERAGRLARGMAFGFLYDPARSLFSIGYNVSTARLDPSRYDLLASEARLASFVAIAKGDVPEKHWFHLGRARGRVDSGRALLSWSGSMFEYLMPLLVMRSYPDTLLDETHTAAVNAHRAYASRRRVPWGISEAAFNVMDLSMTYQYRAFGVPALGLKPGLDEDLVVAPYATALAAAVDPQLAVRNFAALTKEGLEGRFGFYDSIDYTPSRVPAHRRGVVVKTYMAHHQGMTLVALANTLLGAPMQRRFHEVPRVKATELLLQERIPGAVTLVEGRTTRAPGPTPVNEDLALVEVVGLENQGSTRMHLLGHGELAATVSSTGTGALTWRGRDIGRFREDQRLAPAGTFVYVRDVTAGTTWSAGLEPTRVSPASYGATFSVDHVELHRKDGDIETTTEIVVSPEHAVEVRRLTLTNHSAKPRELELTTYMEVVLAPRASDVAHRAFGDMFVETEEDGELGAVLATRRTTPGQDLQPWVVQTLVPESEGWGAVHAESSRAQFLGRGADVTRPRGLEAGSRGTVTRHPLDPAIILRRRVTIGAKATARVSLVTGIADSRDAVLGLARSYAGSAPIARVFELAWADARVELRHLGVSAAQSFRFQRLLSYVLDTHPSLRVAPPDRAPHGDGRATIWSLGISGDLPLVIVRVDGGEVTDICREVLLAHEFFRLNNFSMDLLFLNEETAGYMQPLQDDLVRLVQSSFAQAHVDQRGGVFVRRANAMDETERQLVLSFARVVLRTSAGSLARQLRVSTPTGKVGRDVGRAAPPTERPAPPPLLFDNGSGGFTRDGREYVVHGTSPAPWSNVLANPGFGSLVTERGGGFTWSINSQRFRLSPWSNDACSDAAGEAIYLRNDAGDVWSASAGSVRHAAGCSTFEGTTRGIRHTLSVAVPPDAPVKVSKLTLENQTGAPVHLRVCGYVEWVLGSTRETSRLTTTSWWDDAVPAALAQNLGSPRPERCSFFRATSPVAGWTGDRAELFADYATRTRPSALDGSLSGRSGGALDPCAAIEVDVVLAPGASTSLAFILGEGKDRAEATDLARSWSRLSRVEAALDSTRQFWDDTLGAIQVETPDRAFDLLVNRWLGHQVLACRLWGRSAFYQSGGAFGYRDQLQDVLALLYVRPDLAREHIVRAAARQFEEGDVQHWWHPEDGAGIRTRCADDMLWLVFAAIEYVRVTGDESVLDEPIAFITDRPIPAGQRDVFSTPRTSDAKAPLYEHCVRALDVGLTSGPHGLPLMRAGDWNDGMDRVGADGHGESIWLAWFLVSILRGFEPLASARGDGERAARLRTASSRLLAALDEHGWDGGWYRRGYFDDGSTLGSQSSPECQIDAIAQSWAVIAGGGDADRARRAVSAAVDRLVRDDPPIMMLLTPPFEGRGPDPGYIRAYPPGIRENGGQYTHGVLWTVQALAILGDGDRAHALLSKLNPILHAVTAEDVERYRVEPYVLAGDVYASPEHDGRGGWSWYTGAAGWMYRIAVQWLLGIHLEGSRLTIRPCVPASWRKYSVRMRRGHTIYEITVEPGGPLTVEADGVVVTDGVVAMVDDGHLHTVHVRHERADQLAG
jgi:cyclic beta-1,2-glucan synthetase